MNSSAHVKDERLNKLKMRARRFELMEKFYSRWKEKVQHRAEEKIEETGKEVKWPLSTSLMYRNGMILCLSDLSDYSRNSLLEK